MMSLQAAIYARVSSEHQTDAQTVASQVAALQARVAADGLAVPAERCFVDEGYSGATLVRPALEQLRDLSAAGGLDRLYVHSPDRLARKYAYQALLMDEFQRVGVEVIFLNRSIGQSPEDDLLLQVQGMVAEYERAKIMERSRRGKRYAARQGDVSVLTHAPNGYRYVRKQEGGGQAQFIIDFEEAQVVRQIYTWVGRDKLTLGAVRQRLLEAGTATRTGKQLWSHKTLWDLLTNPTYKGEAAFGKTELTARRPQVRLPPRGKPLPRRPMTSSATPTEDWITIPVPAIVSAELFATVQDQLHDNRRRARQRQTGPRYLLQGVLVCAQCGYAYYGKTISTRWVDGEQRTNAYYRCSGSDSYRFGGERICHNGQIRTDMLDEAVWQEVGALLSNPGRVAHEYRRRLTPSEAGEVGAVEAQLNKVRQGMARLIDSYAEGVIEKGEFEPRLARLRQRAAMLETQRGQLQEAARLQEELHLIIGRLEEFVAKVQQGVATADWTTRRETIHALVKRVEVEADQINVVFRVAAEPFAGSPARGALQHYGERLDTGGLHRDMRAPRCR